MRRIAQRRERGLRGNRRPSQPGGVKHLSVADYIGRQASKRLIDRVVLDEVREVLSHTDTYRRAYAIYLPHPY